MESLTIKIKRFLSVGYGYGYGDGDGSGLKNYNGNNVYYIDAMPTIIESVRGSYARGYVINSDLTTHPCYIARSGDCFAHGDTLHDAVRDAEAKRLENAPIEERIDEAVRRYKDAGKIPARELFNLHHILTGSCEMGRREWCCSRGINIESDSFTLLEFCQMCKDSYGGEAIRQLMSRLE